MKKLLCIIILLFFEFVFTNTYPDLNIDFLINDTTVNKIKKIKETKTKDKKKSFKEIVSNCDKIEGLFTLYWNKKNNQAFIAILPEQFEKVYLAGLTRQSGDGYYLDGSSMMNEFPFMFKKIGERIQFINVNVKFRADEISPFKRSIDRHASNSILSSSTIISRPNINTGAILVDISKLFIYDIEEVSRKSQGVYTFDKKDSYFESIKSFPMNTEIEMALHFKGKKGKYIYTLPSSTSVQIFYNISLSAIPDSNYEPRLADDRIGHFTTIFQDYTNVKSDSPYVRYINRWNLEKQNPQAKISEPKEPIVYWIENTVPYEFRDAVREGILAWNIAFEAIGFKNAIVVKQMPDDADWDPADVRYSTIRWMFQPGRGYAVGPSRANPYTGELYDADIRISADFVRSFYKEETEFVTPLIETFTDDFNYTEEKYHPNSNSTTMCQYGEHLKQEMASGWDIMTASGQISETNLEFENYIHNGLVDLILHEVGHTLGLRHNFKGSSIYSINQLSDSNFTKKYGISGSVMDYQPINIFNKKTFFQTQPGVYDMWAIEYAYAEPNRSKYSEKLFLDNIASRNTDPLLRYGTDEDTYGLSTRGIDPHSNAWDLSNDPMAYYKKRFEMADKLLDMIPEYFEKDGVQYSKIRRVFGRGLRDYYSAARNISKNIGGIYHSRHHVGDPGAKNPFKIVPAKKQRESLQFILYHILDENAFYFDPDLLNKLAPERGSNFTGSVWRMNRIDYPIHDYIRSIQTGTLYRLFHPRILNRIRDNELKFDLEDEIFKLPELFNSITISVWSELDENKNINSFRRDLQKSHIEVLSTILLNEKNYFHTDAVALSRINLNNLYELIRKALDSNIPLDEYTKAHLTESANKIQSVYKAQIVIK